MSEPILELFWQQFDTKVLGTSASNMQRKQCKRAFFAGAQSIVAALAQQDTSVEAGVQRANAMADEIERYFREVEGGRA